MCMSESVDLVDHKSRKHADGQRVGPQFIQPEANNEHGLHQPMREKIKRDEHRAATSQFLRSYTKMRENKIVLVPCKLVLAKCLQPGVQCVDFKPQQHAANRFEYSVDSLDGNPYPKRITQENLAKSAFYHSLERPTSRGPPIGPNSLTMED